MFFTLFSLASLFSSGSLFSSLSFVKYGLKNATIIKKATPKYKAIKSINNIALTNPLNGSKNVFASEKLKFLKN